MRQIMAGCGFLIGVLLVAGMGYLFTHGLPFGNSKTNQQTSGASSTHSDSDGPKVKVPHNREEEMRNEIDKKRIPYFRFLRESFEGKIEKFAVLEYVDTLDLTIAGPDMELIATLVRDALGHKAVDYGFTRARFLVPNTGSNYRTVQFIVFAEASYSDSKWNIVEK